MSYVKVSEWTFGKPTTEKSALALSCKQSFTHNISLDLLSSHSLQSLLFPCCPAEQMEKPFRFFSSLQSFHQFSLSSIDSLTKYFFLTRRISANYQYILILFVGRFNIMSYHSQINSIIFNDCIIFHIYLTYLFSQPNNLSSICPYFN